MRQLCFNAKETAFVGWGKFAAVGAGIAGIAEVVAVAEAAAVVIAIVAAPFVRPSFQWFVQ